MYYDPPPQGSRDVSDPFRATRKQLLMSYGFTPARADEMLDDPMLTSNRWTPLRYQIAQMIDQARDGDSQAQEELRYLKKLFPGVRESKITMMKPAASAPETPGHILDVKRVGTEARHRTLELLQWAYAEGCLDDADFDARQAAAMRAHTQPELDALVTDLPNETPAAAPAPVEAVVLAKPGAGPAGAFAWANLLIWSVLAAFTVLIMVGLPVAPAGIGAAILGNLLAMIRQIAEHRRQAG